MSQETLQAENFGLFLGDIPQVLSETELHEAFAQLGEVTRLDLRFDKKKRKRLAYGFVYYADEETVQRIIDNGQRFTIGDHTLRVGLAERNTTLLISRIPPQIPQQLLQSWLQRIGRLSSFDFSVPTRQCFVSFSSRAEAEKAKKELEGRLIKRSDLDLDELPERKDPPPPSRRQQCVGRLIVEWCDGKTITNTVYILQSTVALPPSSSHVDSSLSETNARWFAPSPPSSHELLTVASLSLFFQQFGLIERIAIPALQHQAQFEAKVQFGKNSSGVESAKSAVAASSSFQSLFGQHLVLSLTLPQNPTFPLPSTNPSSAKVDAQINQDETSPVDANRTSEDGKDPDRSAPETFKVPKMNPKAPVFLPSSHFSTLPALKAEQPPKRRSPSPTIPFITQSTTIDSPPLSFSTMSRSSSPPLFLPMSSSSSGYTNLTPSTPFSYSSTFFPPSPRSSAFPSLGMDDSELIPSFPIPHDNNFLTSSYQSLDFSESIISFSSFQPPSPRLASGLLPSTSLNATHIHSSSNAFNSFSSTPFSLPIMEQTAPAVLGSGFTNTESSVPADGWAMETANGDEADWAECHFCGQFVALGELDRHEGVCAAKMKEKQVKELLEMSVGGWKGDYETANELEEENEGWNGEESEGEDWIVEEETKQIRLLTDQTIQRYKTRDAVFRQLTGKKESAQGGVKAAQKGKKSVKEEEEEEGVKRECRRKEDARERLGQLADKRKQGNQRKMNGIRAVLPKIEEGTSGLEEKR
ncbi:hypothetical protein BLNAU_19032 [Blattamonas nauphoetae]|uniref:RRM domain-containing protein n=1 Tax=Blattamonas nauphoetae TaxID=2049346 RepID=A0ABQ9X2L2_9EUKA|nr:hypothetical protein BLNAU_19032 [Blattamonas nauphoetae]